MYPVENKYTWFTLIVKIVALPESWNSLRVRKRKYVHFQRNKMKLKRIKNLGLQ